MLRINYYGRCAFAALQVHCFWKRMKQGMYHNIELIAREAGKIMLEAADIEAVSGEKTSNADIVTEYDVKVQDFLFSHLSQLYPGAAFVGEEGESSESIGEKISGEAFIIDPIDGTTNFVRNMRKSGISIAYLRGGRVVYGCVYVPYCDEMFTAEYGKGAYLNGKRLACGDRPIEHALASVGTAPYYKKELGDATFGIMRALFDSAMDVRRMGSAVIDVTDVAAGRADIYAELRLSPWDFAASSLIASEAGVRITQMNGESLAFDRKVSVLAASPRCYDFFMSCPEIQRYRELF